MNNSKNNEYRNNDIVIDNDYYGYGNNSPFNCARNDALTAKFTDNLDLKYLLLNTGKAKLNKFVRRKPPEVDEMLMKIRKKISS